MSHTNETVNFHLPQFTADDKPDWLVDVNDAFQAIDTGMEATQSEAESASSVAQLAQTTAENAAETAGQASSDVAGLTTDLETLQGTVNTVTALIGNGTPTTTDKTLIGAINELAAIVEPDRVEVSGDGVKTYSQILDELYALIDHSKLTNNTKLLLIQSATANSVYNMCANSSVAAISLGGVDQNGCWGAQIKASGSALNGFAFSTGTFTQYGSEVLASGQKFVLVY